MAVKPIPKGYHTVTPHIRVQGTAKLIDFLKQAFDAKEIHRLAGPHGTVMHAECRIGDSMVMLGEPMGEWKPMPASIALYVPDADAVYKRALQAGATSLKEPSNQFYGDRGGTLVDPFGHKWTIATHIEDVPPEEISRRMAAMKPPGS